MLKNRHRIGFILLCWFFMCNAALYEYACRVQECNPLVPSTCELD